MLGLLLGSCSNGAGKRRHSSVGSASSDSAFAEVQARGHVAMGVDQYTSLHKFEPLPDGGRIVLQRDARDTAGVSQIRAHMQRIASAFGRGDFTLPGFVHAREVPGIREMRARRSLIRYSADTLPGGAAVRLTTTDSTAIVAIHEFLAFQRHDHRAS
jgi:hypothetical protein